MLHPWTNFSKTCTVFLLLFVCQNVQISAEEYTSDPSASSQQVEQQDDKQLQMAKRAWKQLQSGWGKRMNQEPEDPLRMMPNDDYLDNFRSIDYDANALSQGKANLYDNSEDGETLEKRAWKQMNGAWGKREPNWNQFRGSWGKRENSGNWNNLRGLWGKKKRSEKNWGKLNSAWGKRSDRLY